MASVADQTALLQLLTEIYEDLKGLQGRQMPSTVPALKAITLPTHQALRTQPGDLGGELGPRAVICSGRDSVANGPLDGGEGIFVWDPTSTLADDDVNTIAVDGYNVGRWRKGSF